MFIQRFLISSNKFLLEPGLIKLKRPRFHNVQCTRLFASRTSNDTEKVVASEDDVPLEAQLKNPIVAKLWAARQEAKRRLQDHEGEDNNNTKEETSSTKHEGKPPSVSQTEVSYKFSTDQILRETYQNPFGTMRFGKVLEDLDALAGNIAFNHVSGNPLIVTAGVDRIRLRRRPKIDYEDVHLSGKVTWVGKSSMEIRMQACSEDPTTKENSREEWLEAYFTFVTLDPNTKKAHTMPALIPETSEERAYFELGAMKAKAKKQRRKNKLQVGQPLSEDSLKLDQKAASLLEEASPLIRMPSLADPLSILMQNTVMQNAMIAQPQVRNLHNRVFGGFLMRRAFELAFATAYVFGGKLPKFLEVDDISFEFPVDVGDLLVFNSRVLYTLPNGMGHNAKNNNYVIDHSVHHPLIMVEVEAWVTEPESVKARVSNHFNFTFALPEGTPCRTVLPSNIDEARRMATRIAADAEQATMM